MRLIKIGIRTLIITSITLLLFLCILFSIIQTEWGKRQIKDLITSELNKMGICTEIEGLEGQLPFSWKIAQITLHPCTSDTTLAIRLEKIRLRIAFFPLLRGHLAIDYLNAETAEYRDSSQWYSKRQLRADNDIKERGLFSDLISFLNSSHQWEQIQHAVQFKLTQLLPPLSLHVHHLQIEQVRCLLDTQEWMFSLTLKGKWDKETQEFLSFCKAAALDNPRLFIEFFINGSRQRSEISTGIKACLNTIAPSFLPDPISSTEDVFCECYIKGPWQTWKSLIWNTPPGLPTDSLLFKVKTQLSSLHSDPYPILNGNWQLNSQFRLFSNRLLSIDRFQLLSNLIQCKAKGTLTPDLSQSQGIIAYVFPNLSLFSNIQGSCKGKIDYDQGDLKTTIATSHLKTEQHFFGKLQGQLLAHYRDLWQGSVTLSIQDLIEQEIKGSSQLKWIPNQKIQFEDVHIDGLSSSTAGDLTIYLPECLLDGSLYGHIDQLSDIRPIFPEYPLEGRVGIECDLSSVSADQQLYLNLLFKNLRYGNQLIDDLSLSVNLANLYQNPEGSVQLLAEKIYTSYAYFDQISVQASSDSEKWPFSLVLQGIDSTPLSIGSNPNPCELNLQGWLEHRSNTITLHFNQAQGIIAEHPLALQTPCTLFLKDSQISLSPCQWIIGTGSLTASGSLTPDHSFLQLQTQHFPLNTLCLFNPRLAIEGSVTSSCFLDATEKNLEGACNIALEQARFLHNKQKPLKAKGSLQAHLDQGLLQIHTDLHAVNEQFLETAASIPLTYSCYPFHVDIDRKAPFQGQIVMEGRIQDLFDFVNIGTHHMTGFISSYLLFSHTWQSPFVQGEISLQNGTYDNYYTGTVLKEMNAEVQAHQHTLHLLNFTAHDEEKGEFTAEGSLELNSQAGYPYEIFAQLDHLHLLRFNTIDAHLTGPLTITGTSREAVAKGSLTIPFATFRIPDHLPFNIPELPVQFINRPDHLTSPSPSVRAPFPFHMDLDLSADKDIHVEGKGVSSEWKGAVHLTGTNTQVAANGSLSLLNGEYLFSGKIFKLIEGSIIFKDKPAPSATLNLSGNLSLSDLEVIAVLRGPLTSPQLTFHSNPHMPTSAILAKILFNKEMSDISHPEALQLANTLMSLSGGAGPNVLEAIRKSIGVDRLTIASAHTGSDQMAIQIGKYLTKGVLITLSQSTTSSQVIVEVDLSKGFILQAETQEEEEGKFSLKWRKSY